METEFLNKLAEAYNKYDVSIIENELADDMHYASLWVFEEINSKKDFLNYLREKLYSMKSKGVKFDFEIVSGRMHDNALLVRNQNCGFVVEFDSNNKVKMINMTSPAFF